MIFILVICFDVTAGIAIQIIHNSTSFVHKDQLSILAGQGQYTRISMVKAFNMQHMRQCERTNQESVKQYREKLHENMEDMKEQGWRALMEDMTFYQNIHSTDESIKFNYSME
jgi:hypothetical protein